MQGASLKRTVANGVSRRALTPRQPRIALGGAPLPPLRRPAFAQRQAPAEAQRLATVARGLAESDDDREQGRSYRRTVFNQAMWRNHRSISRYFRHLDGVLTSRIVRGLLPPLACVLLSSYIVCLYEQLWQEGTLDAVLPFGYLMPDLAVSPDGPFSISTFALSLLLVFRTNSSYDRWWEAASAWNEIVSSVCHLARQACQWLPSAAPEEERPRAALLRWLRAFPVTVMCAVREEEDQLPTLLQGVLTPDEAALLIKSRSAPQTCLTVLGTLISGSRMTIDSKTHMDESVRRLQEAYDCAVKIVSTPLPLSYSRHTSRFLVTWLTFLPFCAWRELGWGTVPVDLILGFFLLGIEEIGVQVEEPLGVLPLEHGCGIVSDCLAQMSEEHGDMLALREATMAGDASVHLGVAAATAAAPARR